MEFESISDQLCNIAIAPHSISKTAIVHISAMAGLDHMPYLIKAVGVIFSEPVFKYASYRAVQSYNRVARRDGSAISDGF